MPGNNLGLMELLQLQAAVHHEQSLNARLAKLAPALQPQTDPQQLLWQQLAAATARLLAPPQQQWGWAAGPAGPAAPGAPAPDLPLPDPATTAAKLAAAREKNRLAQQRFRKRQRAKQKQAGEQCEEMQREMDQVWPCGGALGPTYTSAARSQPQQLHMHAHSRPLPWPPVQLEEEINLLQAQNRMYQKVLAVRDAMLQTFAHLPRPEEQAQAAGGAEKQAETVTVPAQPEVPAPATAAAQGLAAALSELPSEGEMHAAAPAPQSVTAMEVEEEGGPSAASAPQPPSLGEGSPAPGSAGDSCAATCGAASHSSPPPQSLLGEPHRLGTAAELDGSALQGVELIPPPSNQAVLDRISAMQGPEDLVGWGVEAEAAGGVGFPGRSWPCLPASWALPACLMGPACLPHGPCLPACLHPTPPCCPAPAPRPPRLQLAFVREWQADLAVAFEAAAAAGFEPCAAAEAEAVVNRMAEMWWHVGQLRPAYLSHLAHATMPANSSQLPLWREIAGEVMPYIDENGLALVVCGGGRACVWVWVGGGGGGGGGTGGWQRRCEQLAAGCGAFASTRAASPHSRPSTHPSHSQPAAPLLAHILQKPGQDRGGRGQVGSPPAGVCGAAALRPGHQRAACARGEAG